MRVNKSMGLKIAMVTLTTLATAIFMPVQFASAAASPPVVYRYLLGQGLLCDLDPSACPDVAQAANGDTVEITGSGLLVIADGPVATGAGRFVHRDPSGAVVGSGRWLATRLLSFTSYGCGGPGLPNNFCGGQAQIRVILFASNGLVSTGTLTIDCAIGDAIPPGATEGTKLFVDKFSLDFSQEVSGFTILIK